MDKIVLGALIDFALDESDTPTEELKSQLKEEGIDPEPLIKRIRCSMCGKMVAVDGIKIPDSVLCGDCPR